MGVFLIDCEWGRLCAGEASRGILREGGLGGQGVWVGKPAIGVRGGCVAWGARGVPDAGVAAPQPVHRRPKVGAYGGERTTTSITFLSQAAVAASVPQRLGLRKTVSSVRGCRSVTKADMVHNHWTPHMEIDAQTYEVRADGQLLTCEPATELPMAQRYFLF